MTDLDPVRNMLARYRCRNNGERQIALREIVQEITLIALERAGFFIHAAFYGGTALRIFHGLERFSEDLDFSLMQKDPDFNLDDYLPSVRDELGSFGFDMVVERKLKSRESTVQSAFIKGGTVIHLMKIASIVPPISGIDEHAQMKIKFEIDTDPPEGAGYEIKYRLAPIPYSVRLYDRPSLFAGKMHALLCRGWKDRVKGRDFFDYVWYLTNYIPVNRAHLESRMRQSGHWTEERTLSGADIHRLIGNRFAAVDFGQARKDVLPYIQDSRFLDQWNEDFFRSITRERLTIIH